MPPRSALVLLSSLNGSGEVAKPFGRGESRRVRKRARSSQGLPSVKQPRRRKTRKRRRKRRDYGYNCTPIPALLSTRLVSRVKRDGKRAVGSAGSPTASLDRL